VVFYGDDGEPAAVWPGFPDGDPVRFARPPYATLRAVPLAAALDLAEARTGERPEPRRRGPVPISLKGGSA